MSSQSQQISSLQSRPNKRKASELSTASPPLKMRKQPTALESRLTELRALLNNLRPSWNNYDTDCFMDEMRRLGRYFNRFTPSMIEKYIENGQNKMDLGVLKLLEDEFDEIQKDDTSTPFINSQAIKRRESARQSMLAYLKQVRRCLEALVAQAQVKPPPCEFADYKQWRIHQEKANPILCLRPADQKGLPLPLMHPAFCTFTRHLHEPLLDEHTPKYLTMADKLCQVMPSAFNSEAARRDAFEAIFQPLDDTLEQHVEYSLSANALIKTQEPGARPEVAKPILKGLLVLTLREFKLEEGDAYMQICRAFEVLSDRPKSKLLLKFGNPMFLLCVLGMYQMFIPNNTFLVWFPGPNFMVCGAVKREQVHVEPLTMLIPMLPGFGIQGRPIQLAYCLQALKQGLDELRRFWPWGSLRLEIRK
ncbi:hypothetical protein CPB86DRAFT_366083 [Serendipita vermifera]|nr:hypothetical protein CPB86DRAFT_366083 [Serendipita vermifera]